MFPRLARHISLILAALGIALPPAASGQESVAVLLPQKGRLMQVGQSIRDGLLAAYYQDSLTHPDTPLLRFYDSSDVPARELVRIATQNGARMIIGPLERDQVQNLLADRSPPVTVIALNRGEGSHPNLIQMALAPEDEISALAHWMYQRGLRRPLMLTVNDDSNAGRFVDLFAKAWSARDKQAPATHLLDVRQKGGIAAAIRQLPQLAPKADSLFLASPGIANQVQPALTYYGLGLPLFSLSSAWDPGSEEQQRDMNGMGFCGLPWLLDGDRPEQQALYNAQGRPNASHDRLHALGADAWTVARSLETLRKGESLSLRTGTLTLTPDGHLDRRPACAEIRHGVATIIQEPEKPAE